MAAPSQRSTNGAKAPHRPGDTKETSIVLEEKAGSSAQPSSTQAYNLRSRDQTSRVMYSNDGIVTSDELKGRGGTKLKPRGILTKIPALQTTLPDLEALTTKDGSRVQQKTHNTRSRSKKKSANQDPTQAPGSVMPAPNKSKAKGGKSGQTSKPIEVAHGSTTTVEIPTPADEAKEAKPATQRTRNRGSRRQRDHLGFFVTSTLPGFPPSTAVIPEDATLEDICRYYPNHLFGVRLDPFIQHRWTGIDIWRHLSDKGMAEFIRYAMRAHNRKQRVTILDKRLDRRIDSMTQDEILDLVHGPELRKASFTGISRLRGMYLTPEERALRSNEERSDDAEGKVDIEQDLEEDINADNQSDSGDVEITVDSPQDPTSDPNSRAMQAQVDDMTILAAYTAFSGTRNEEIGEYLKKFADAYELLELWSCSILNAADTDLQQLGTQNEILRLCLFESNDTTRQLFSANTEAERLGLLKTFAMDKLHRLMLQFARDNGLEDLSVEDEENLADLQTCAAKHVVLEMMNQAEALDEYFTNEFGSPTPQAGPSAVAPPAQRYDPRSQPGSHHQHPLAPNSGFEDHLMDEAFSLKHPRDEEQFGPSAEPMEKRMRFTNEELSQADFQFDPDMFMEDGDVDFQDTYPAQEQPEYQQPFQYTQEEEAADGMDFRFDELHDPDVFARANPIVPFDASAFTNQAMATFQQQGFNNPAEPFYQQTVGFGAQDFQGPQVFGSTTATQFAQPQPWNSGTAEWDVGVTSATAEPGYQQIDWDAFMQGTPGPDDTTDYF